MKRNVGGIDRILRGVLGTAFVLAALLAARTNRRRAAVASALASAGLLWNAATGFCGLNWLLGIDTCGTSEK